MLASVCRKKPKTLTVLIPREFIVTVELGKAGANSPH